MTTNRISHIIQSEPYYSTNTVDIRKVSTTMISFDDFIAEDGIPIYLQVVRHIKRGIVAGIVLNGDEVPSRRVLSALLGVNPNTIQKSYAILESERLMESRSGAKSYMVLDEESVARVRSQLLENDATTVVNSLKQMGLSKEEALALIENYWE